jgi:hypothetical protein
MNQSSSMVNLWFSKAPDKSVIKPENCSNVKIFFLPHAAHVWRVFTTWKPYFMRQKQADFFTLDDECIAQEYCKKVATNSLSNMGVL